MNPDSTTRCHAKRAVTAERPSSPTAGTRLLKSAQLEGTSPKRQRRFGAAPWFGDVILMVSNLLRPKHQNCPRRLAMPYAGKVTAKHAKFTNRITAVRGTISVGPQKETKATKMRSFVDFAPFCSKLRALAVSAPPNVPDQRPRATGAANASEPQSLGSLHPVCSAIDGPSFKNLRSDS